MLLVYFYREDGGGGCRQFQSETLADAAIAAGLERISSSNCPPPRRSPRRRQYGPAQAPVLAEMVGLPGIAIIDYSDPQAPYHGSCQYVPLSPRTRLHARANERDSRSPTRKAHQRTLIYAIKTHPERPQSASATSTPTLRRRRRATPNPGPHPTPGPPCLGNAISTDQPPPAVGPAGK